jgi:AcrR family transcriptional regulator
MPRRRSLTSPGIAAAALAVIERDGLAALSMRAVAGELGVGTMSLYRYVDSREQLEGLVVDHVLSAVRLDVAPGVPWSARLGILVGRVREVIVAHTPVIPLLLTHRGTNETTARWGEAVAGALAEGGFEGRDRVIAFRTLLAFVIGAVQVEHFGPLAGEGTAALAALPREEFPFLADTAVHARGVPSDDEFRGGLAVVLRGLGIDASILGP